MSFDRSDRCLRFQWAFSVLALFFSGSFALNWDGTLLLSFKYSVLSDPLSVLENWDYNDNTPCLWTGVTCAEIGTSFASPDMFRVISLVLPGSQLLGSIPEDLGLIQHLRTLDLSYNFLNGTLPTSLFNTSELQVLHLSNNKIFGELPELIEGLSGLQFINLSDNALAGMLPENLTSLKNLTVVSLRSNYFSGSVPGGFNSVEVLDLSSNLFNGSLPINFGGQSLRYLNLSYNKLSGSISPEFAKEIPTNATIDISFNNLTGEIPQSMALGNQKIESFAGNTDLCGKPLKKLCIIPSTLSTPPNVSTNNSPPAIAAIPRAIDSTPVPGSPGSGSPNGAENQQQRRLKPGTIAAIAVGDLAGIGILAMIFLYVYQLKKRKRLGASAAKATTISNKEEKDMKEEPPMARALAGWSCLNVAGETSEATTGSDSDDNHNSGGNEAAVEYDKEQNRGGREKLLVMVDGETELELETLLKASAYVLGSSGASIVYKAVLEEGTALAVRRIGESGVGRLRDFENQVRAIAKLRHPNLVRVRGFYWGEDEKLVIYDYVSNGSLASAGYKKISSSPCRLPFEVRLKIARGVARGLAYVHEKKHVHGNIKPTNILLNPDMEPVISDLGLDRLLSADSSDTTNNADGSTRHFGSRRSTAPQDQQLRPSSPYAAVAAGYMGCTSPYHAPESLKSLKPSPKWDVYSFGILLLELLTGRVFSDRELGQWAAGSVADDRDRVLRMADVGIRGDLEGRQDAMLACFKLGFSCASLAPQKRPSMKDAGQVLDKITCSSRQ